MKIVRNTGKKYELNRANKKFEIFNSHSMLSTSAFFCFLPPPHFSNSSNKRDEPAGYWNFKPRGRLNQKPETDLAGRVNQDRNKLRANVGQIKARPCQLETVF